jgi:hypothetical protein
MGTARERSFDDEEKGKEGRGQGTEKGEVGRFLADGWGAARWVAPFFVAPGRLVGAILELSGVFFKTNC